MSRCRWHAMAVLLACLTLTSAAFAQQNTPRIGYAFPAGGRQGTTFEVTVGGQYLDGVSDAYLSGEGVRVTVGEHFKPLTAQQVQLLRDRLEELQDKRKAAASRSATRPTWTDDDDKELAEIRQKLATYVRRPSSPAISESVTLQVTISATAPPGRRELRLKTARALTNPLVFCVGQLPEFAEKVTKNAGEPTRSVPRSEMSITLPAIVNGQIGPGGVDRYRFPARKGQKLVVAVSARELIPYLADAVPGWFQATVALYDADGKELAYADDYRFNPDPVLCYEIPKDGEYAIEIKDSIYRGREDFVYRITVGELPFITSIFPLGGSAGAPTTVEVKGWNLPATTLTPTTRFPGISPVFVRRGDLFSNTVPFAVDTLPERLDQEPNNRPEASQPATTPVIVNGRIDQPGDCDVFRIDGRAGSEIVAEVYARRLNSPLDSALTLTDASGRQLATNDDHEDKAAGLHTHHADSILRATLPTDGIYYIHLSDAQRQGGAEYAYRLRISPPRPDFELRVTPSSPSARGGNVPLTVHVLRKDGFSGEIDLALKDAPAGFTLKGAKVPANQDQVRLTLSVPPSQFDEPLTLRLEGHAKIGDREIVRPAVPAEDMMQAFAYRHLVPSKELMVLASGGGLSRTGIKILTPTPLRIPAGGAARIRVAIPTNTFRGKVQLELSNPPKGISIRETSPIREGTEIVLQADATLAKPGLKGNLIIQALVERTPLFGTDKGSANRRPTPMGTLPAIPFEILAP